MTGDDDDSEYSADEIDLGTEDDSRREHREGIKTVLLAEQGDRVKQSGFPVWRVIDRVDIESGPAIVLKSTSYPNRFLTLLTPTGETHGYPLEMWYCHVSDDGTVEKEQAQDHPVTARLLEDRDWNKCDCGDLIQTLSHYQKADKREGNHAP